MNVFKFGVNIGYRGIGIWSVSGTSRTECHVSDLYVGKQRHRRRNPLTSVLASFPIALIKFSDKSHLIRNEFIVAHSSSHSAPGQRYQGSRDLKQLITVYPQ